MLTESISHIVAHILRNSREILQTTLFSSQKSDLRNGEAIDLTTSKFSKATFTRAKGFLEISGMNTDESFSHPVSLRQEDTKCSSSQGALSTCTFGEVSRIFLG